MPEWGRELEPAQGPWDLGRGLLTDDADADGTAFLGPVAGMGGHTAVGPLILRPYLREEQHRAGGQGQGCALGGGGQEAVTTRLHIPCSCLCLHIYTHLSSSPAPCLPLSVSPRPPSCPLRISTSQPPLQVTHILDPVDLRRRLGRGFTGQGHGPTRSYGSTFRVHHQLDLQRHRLWGWEGA